MVLHPGVNTLNLGGDGGRGGLWWLLAATIVFPVTNNAMVVLLRSLVADVISLNPSSGLERLQRDQIKHTENRKYIRW